MYLPFRLPWSFLQYDRSSKFILALMQPLMQQYTVGQGLW